MVLALCCRKVEGDKDKEATALGGYGSGENLLPLCCHNGLISFPRIVVPA